MPPLQRPNTQNAVEFLELLSEWLLSCTAQSSRKKQALGHCPPIPGAIHLTTMGDATLPTSLGEKLLGVLARTRPISSGTSVVLLGLRLTLARCGCTRVGEPLLTRLKAPMPSFTPPSKCCWLSPMQHLDDCTRLSSSLEKAQSLQPQRGPFQSCQHFPHPHSQLLSQLSGSGFKLVLACSSEVASLLVHVSPRLEPRILKSMSSGHPES